MHVVFQAAILQQTAEYIYNLEQEKTRLLSQNSQLMRQVHQHEGADVPPKKRKTELAVHVASESSDEGLGSMSPEPVALVLPAAAELMELRRQLEHERSVRMHLEEQIRNLEAQYQQYSQYATAPLFEQADIKDGIVTVVQDELEMQLVAADSVPPVGQTQTVVCSPVVSRSPSPSRTCTPPPSHMPQQTAIVRTVEEPMGEVLDVEHSHHLHRHHQEAHQRLPSALEAAIKAEPKVEVERLPSPTTPHDDVGCSRLYVANTSRQNLETIVEAIRHLEGDHLFGDEPTSRQRPPQPQPQAQPQPQPQQQQQSQPQAQPQEAPLALTNKRDHQQLERLLEVEMNPFLQFHASSVQQQQQSRPGVIVVKQHS